VYVNSTASVNHGVMCTSNSTAGLQATGSEKLAECVQAGKLFVDQGFEYN